MSRTSKSAFDVRVHGRRIGLCAGLLAIVAMAAPLAAQQTGTPPEAPLSAEAAHQTPAAAKANSRARVAIVVFENIGYDAIIGNPAAPNFNRLAREYGQATNASANTHPSMGNYFMMTTGRIISNDDAFVGTISDDNLVRQFAASGKTWKVYAQSLPAVGYTGGDRGYYSKHHNPFAYFSDVIGTEQANNIVPLSQLASDLASGNMPDFAFIIPDNAHNGHDCPGRLLFCTEEDRLQVADEWLPSLDPLLTGKNFGDGVLVVTFDEADFTDHKQGGGHILVVLAGDRVRHASRSKVFMQQENVLRFVCDFLALSGCPGAGATASNPLKELLQPRP